MKNKTLLVIFTSLLVFNGINAESWFSFSELKYRICRFFRKSTLTEQQKQAIETIKELQKTNEKRYFETINCDSSTQEKKDLYKQQPEYYKNIARHSLLDPFYLSDLTRDTTKNNFPFLSRAHHQIYHAFHHDGLAAWGHVENQAFHHTLQDLTSELEYTNKQLENLEKNDKNYNSLVKQQELLTQEITSFTNPENRNAFTRSYPFPHSDRVACKLIKPTVEKVLKRKTKTTFAEILIGAREDYDRTRKQQNQEYKQ